MHKHSSLSIIIVNWNSGRQLCDCLDSIREFGAPYVSQTVVVDNGSSDGSVNAARDAPGITLVEARENLGFAKACNLGAQLAQAEYLLFFNPDAALHKDTLSIAVSFMNRPEHTNVGICGVRLVDEHGETTTCASRFPTLKVLVGSTLGLARVLPRIFPPLLMTPGELSQSRPVDQVIGAFFLIRKSVFDLCRGFDERFFVYFEEVDLSLRAKQLGYGSYYIAEATAFHMGGGSTGKVKATRLFYLLRSRLCYTRKHFTEFSYALSIILTALELPLRVFRGIVRGSWEDVQNTLRAYSRLMCSFFRRS